MYVIRTTPSQALVFGLDWEQQDVFTSQGATLQRWRGRGYTLGAGYPHADGKV